MSGYSFYCTPCGYAHAGECPPKKEAPATAPPSDEIEITLGSRWRGQRRSNDQTTGLVGLWYRDGWPDGYEVLAIISDGTTQRSHIQVKACNTVGAVVWTIPIAYWFEDGWYNAVTRCDEKMIPWV